MSLNRYAFLTLLLSLRAAAAAPLVSFDFDTGDAAQVWNHKSNTTTAVVADRPQSGGGALRFTIDPAEFAYGWVHTGLPEADYTGLHGIHGYFRAPVGTLGTLLFHVCLQGAAGQEMSYFRSDLGSLADSQGEWVPFYVAVGDLRYERGPVRTIEAAALKPGELIQFLASVDGRAPVSIDIDSVALLNAADGAALAREVKTQSRQRLLLAADKVSGAPHPRLFFTPDWLPRYRAKAAIGGERQAAYQRLIAAAEELLKSHDANDPLGKLYALVDTSKLEGTPFRAAFEGQLVEASWPLEVLGAAYQLTGDARFGDQGAKALANAAKRLTVDEPFLDRGFYYTRTLYVRALAFGYDWLWDKLTPDDRRTVKATLLGFVTNIHEHSQTDGWGRRPLHRVWNWDPGLMGACGVGLLALEGETRLGEKGILFDCRRHLRDYLTLGIDADGCGHEGPIYLGYGSGAGVEFVELLRRQGRGDLFTETNYQLIPPWLLAETLPDGKRWNNLSDCGHDQRNWPAYLYACGRLSELAKTEAPVAGERWSCLELRQPLNYLQQFAESPGPRRLNYPALAGLMGWEWQHGPGSRDPAALDPREALAHVLLYEPCQPVDDPAKYLPLALHFRGRGLVVCRTGFGPDDFHLAVEAGPHAAGHDQSDKGTFTLGAYGADLAIDSGYGNDGDPQKSGSSYAHNVVLIDGEGQPMRYHNQSSGHVTGFHHSSLLDWIRVDAREAWSVRYDGDWVPSPTPPVARADRTFVFVRPSPQQGVPGYLVVYDDIAKDVGEHDYTWQWHIPADRAFAVSESVWSAVPRGMTHDVLTSEAAGPGGTATFRLNVPTAGKYVLYGLVRAGGPELSKSDSFFVSVDGGDRLTWDLKTGAALSWDPVQDRAEAGPRAFDLTAGEHSIRLEIRERQAELARFVLLPEDAPAPVDPDGSPAGAPSMGIEDAKLDGGGFVVHNPAAATGTPVTMDVFPLRPAGGKVTTDWFVTSREGAHPRLQYTVRSADPQFVVVLVPRREGTPRPTVEALAGEGAVGVAVRWPQTTDLLAFSRDAGSAGQVQLEGSAGFVRVANEAPADWALLDGRQLAFGGKVLAALAAPGVQVQTGAQ